jgi:hypothetical protein
MKKILFVIGSYNQTTQMHKIASFLPEYDCYFTQFYSDHFIIKAATKVGLMDNTILAGQFKASADRYLEEHHLQNDYAQSRLQNDYDLIVVCSDLLVPHAFRGKKTIWVQEGMTDRLTSWARMVRKVGLPRYLSGGTSLNGTSNLCDIYCVASAGYKEYFHSLGTDSSKLVVTGMPNFDHVSSFQRNDFPHHGYVLVATSDIRETYGVDNRRKFIEKAVRIANGRQLIFKLHPNEKADRALAEIRKYAPDDTLIYTSGNINHMIANCDELITQYSTVVYVGMALNKKVHSYFNIRRLRQLMPLQNEGRSAQNIAAICRQYIKHDGSAEDFREQLSSVWLQDSRTLQIAS